MYRISDNIVIPDAEVSFTASRSGGPGGQNVNKVSSRVTLLFDVSASASLSEDEKQRVAERLATRMNKDGVLRVVSQRTRSQELNRLDAQERFVELLQRALTQQRVRIKTRVTAAAKQKRLDRKKKRTVVKQARSRGRWEE